MLYLILSIAIGGYVLIGVPNLIFHSLNSSLLVKTKTIRIVLALLGLIAIGTSAYLLYSNHYGLASFTWLLISSLFVILAGMILSPIFRYQFVPAACFLLGFILCFGLVPAGKSHVETLQTIKSNHAAYISSMRANASSEKQAKKEAQAYSTSQKKAKLAEEQALKNNPTAQIKKLYAGSDIKDQRNLKYALATVNKKVTRLSNVKNILGNTVTTDSGPVVYIALASNSPYTREAVTSTESVMKQHPNIQLMQLYPIDGDSKAEDVKALYSYNSKSKKDTQKVLGNVVLENDQIQQLVKDTNLSRVPAMFVIDGKGNIKMTDIGVFDTNTLTNAINIGLGSYNDE